MGWDGSKHDDWKPDESIQQPLYIGTEVYTGVDPPPPGIYPQGCIKVVVITT